MIPESIRKQAFWLYGVIVGLAIKEAITLVLPHLFDAPPNTRSQHFPEVLRLAVFLILAVRFYLGASIYFDEAYEQVHEHEPDEEGSAPPEPENKFRRKNFGIDFLFGFFHFIVFSALALSIRIDQMQDPDQMRNALFLMLIGVILIYDLFWLGINWSNDTFHLIKKWAFLNLATVIISAVLFGLVFVYFRLEGTEFDFMVTESIVLMPVILISMIDIIELIMGKPIIARSLTWLADKIRSVVTPA